jgi:hypothetical protein
MRLLFISFFSFLTVGLFAQGFKGTVLDSKNNKPIPDCLVIIKATTNSAITDQQGKFVLPPIAKETKLVITMLGYTTAEFSNILPSDTFYLVPKDNQLKEVVIVANKKQVLNANDDFPILDFDLLNDHLIILTPGKDQNELKLLNDNGQFITKLKAHPSSISLKKDCINNLQLFSPDSAWQIFFDFEKLNSLNPYSLPVYENILGHCVCSKNNTFYFRNMEYRNLRTSYYYFTDEEKGVRHDLISFGDTAKIRSFEKDYDLRYFLDVRRKSNYSLYNEPVDSIKKKMPKYREELQLDWAYLQWLGNIETEMVRKDSELFIVNFTDTLIYKITPGNKISPQCRFDVLNEKDLNHKVYSDEANRDNYIMLFKNREIKLIKFDIRSGKRLSETTIPNVPYHPKKLIINDGKVYFIQKNLADEQTYKLVKYYLYQ